MQQLRHRAADGPGNFFARDEPVRIAAALIYEVFAAFQIVKTTGLPAVVTPHREQPIKQWCHTFLADCSGALFHFVVSQIIQEPNRAGFDSRENITQSSCAAGRRSCPMSAKRRGAASTSSAQSNQRGRHL